MSHSTFVDPEVVYATCDAPDKNMSSPVHVGIKRLSWWRDVDGFEEGLGDHR